MSDRKSTLPFHIFLKNKPIKPWDDYIKESIAETKSFEELIEGNVFLRNLKKPNAWKEVAKTFFALGVEPGLIGQGFDINSIMGSVGEALTELLLPGDEIPINNKGHDISYKGNYIEVKSTVTKKVTMSNSQYRQSDYLIMHRFHKKTGYYNKTYLIPIRVLSDYKPNREHSVSVDLEVDKWARNLFITPERLIEFFKKITESPELKENKVCVECHARVVQQGLFDIRNLVESCVNCDCLLWEQRYAHYERLFFAPHTKAIRHHVTRSERDQKDLEHHKSSNWYFSRTLNPEGKSTLLKTLPAELAVSDNLISVHFCPSAYNTSKPPRDAVDIDVNFYDLYRLLQAYNEKEDMPVREFFISFNQSDLILCVRSGMAAVGNDGKRKEFRIDQLVESSPEMKIAKLVRRLQSACIQ